MKVLNRSSLLVASALATGLVAMPAAAQENADGATTNKNVIVVTARKKEENLQGVPLTVNVFGEDFIDDANIKDIEELSEFTPGFQQQSAFGRDGDRPIIRGTSNILISEGKVGFFIDGVPYIGDSSALDLENFQRVEIIKGPQSAVFGRGTLSGAINYVSKGAVNEFEGSFELTAATHDEYQAFARLAAPLAEGISAFVSGKYYTRGGDYTNALNGNDLGEESIVGTAGLRFDVDNFRAGLTYMYAQDDDDHYAIGLQDSSFNNIYKEGSRGYYQGVVELREPIALNTDLLLNPGIERESHRVIATAEMDLGDSGFSVNAQYGYSQITERSGTDQTFDGSDVVLFSSFLCNVIFAPDCAFGVSGFNTDGERERRSHSAEIRLLSPQDRPFRFELGGFFFDDRGVTTGYGLKQTEFGFDNIGETDEVTNLAAFGSIAYDFTDRLTASAELRVAKDEIGTRPGASFRLGDLFPSAPSPDRIIAGAGAVRDASFGSVLPRFTLDYEAADNLLVYAVYSEGNSPGGFNGITAPVATFDEERLKNYELGFKSEPVDGLILNVAGFFIDYSDQVLTSTFTNPTTGNPNSFSDNVGDTEIKGLEVEASFAVNEYLTLSATYGYIDAEIVNGLNSDQSALLGGLIGTGTVENPDVPGTFINTTNGCANPATTLNAGQPIGDGTLTTAPTPCATFADISGQTPPLVSKHQASASAVVTVPFGDSDWRGFGRADVTYRSSFFAQIHNLAETGDSTKVNLSLGARNDNLTIRLWVKNLLQDDSIRGILRYVDFGAPRLNSERQRAFAITPSERRQFGLTVSGNF